MLVHEVLWLWHQARKVGREQHRVVHAFEIQLQDVDCGRAHVAPQSLERDGRDTHRSSCPLVCRKISSREASVEASKFRAVLQDGHVQRCRAIPVSDSDVESPHTRVEQVVGTQLVKNGWVGLYDDTTPTVFPSIVPYALAAHGTGRRAAVCADLDKVYVG